MRILAVKQQKTNRAQGFASGRHLGTCALVCVCDCFLIYFQVTTLSLLLYLIVTHIISMIDIFSTYSNAHCYATLNSKRSAKIRSFCGV